ncbi:hypothetical protein [Amycolatopsis sp. WAC 04197]|uniref:hypothetical protein n=1 Tax=Amycolatopsis sp. WAC 04197 TaxID=2203199 RepID=UPI000F7A9E92|nr:hypothetical protein [Amycolatopsis sp. WAC 04197]
MKQKVVVGTVVAILTAWVIAITIVIALQPDVGVESPEKLREQLSNALNSRDSKALESLIAYPPGDADDFAESYMKKLDDVAAKSITVSLKPNSEAPNKVAIAGTLGDGADFSYDVSLVQGRDGWRLELIPPL